MGIKPLVVNYNYVLDTFEKYYSNQISDRKSSIIRDEGMITFYILSHKFKLVAFIDHEKKLAFYTYEVQTIGTPTPKDVYLEAFSFSMSKNDSNDVFSFLDGTTNNADIDTLLTNYFKDIEGYITEYGFMPDMPYE